MHFPSIPAVGLGARDGPAGRPADAGEAATPLSASAAAPPARLSVTAIETWLRDPYAIHARHILKLVALKPLDEATDAVRLRLAGA